MAVFAVLCGLALSQETRTINFDGDSKQQSHWGYVIGIIAFILVLQGIGLGIEYWYKGKLNEFLAQTGQAAEARNDE